MALSKIKGTVIADDAINADRIEDGTVVASDILDNTITGGKLATDITISTTGSVTANTFSGDGSSLTALNISTDSTPQLGGNLDLNSNNITGTGNIDITGTVTSDGLTVGGSSDNSQYAQFSSSGTRYLRFSSFANSGNDNAGHDINASSSFGAITLSTGDTTRFKVDLNGDISFYEGTGTNPRIKYDASTEFVVNEDSVDFDFRVESNSNTHALFVDGGNSTVSINSSDNTYNLQVDHTTGENATIVAKGAAPAFGLYDTTSSVKNWLLRNSDGTLGFWNTDNTNGFNSLTNTVNITSDGKVGVGTTSPNADLDISKTGSSGVAKLVLTGGDGQVTESVLEIFATGLAGSGAERTCLNAISNSNALIAFQTNSVERASIKNTETVINEDSNDYDFRVESNNDTHALFVQGSDGRVGIGTSSVTEALDVRGSATTLQYDNDGAAGPAIQQYHNSASPADDDVVGRLRFFGNDSSANKTSYAEIKAIATDVSEAGEESALSFFTTYTANLTEGVRIYDSGRINACFVNYEPALNDNSVHEFQMNSNNSTYSNGVVVSTFRGNRTTTPLYSGFHTSSGEGATPTLKFQVASDGDVTNVNNSYGAISDEKLKEQIQDASSQWNDIKALTIRKFKMKSDVIEKGDSDELWRLGVIAQEVESAGMSGIVKNKDDYDNNGNELGTVTKSVKYSVLYMKAVKALQEAMQKIEDLEARVNTLEGN